MEDLQQCSRSPTQQHTSHDPTELAFPQVPQHDLTTHKQARDITLPDLRTVLSPQFEASAQASAEAAFASRCSPLSAGSLPPIDIGNNSGYANGTRRSMDMAMASPSEAGSLRSEEGRGRRTKSIVSMEDPDVRLAAEALSGLGNPDFVRSPKHAPSQAVSPPTNNGMHASVRENELETEPLLQLFASKHPWVGGTMNASINSSMFVYNTTKHYSPRFVQYGANLVERNIATPMANTVGSVGRYTGVEGGLRRYLDEGRPRDIEKGDEDRMDIDSDNIRRDSAENLPPYRSSKPPSYREEYSPAALDRSQQRPPHNRSWSSQVAGQMFVMTSGLGVALSVTSRRSLQYCLQFLSQATVHIATVSDALKMVLEQYDEARDSWHKNNEKSMEEGQRPKTPDHDEAARRLADIIKKHSDDIWTTLKQVTNYVSSSAGGALPDNARHFVTNQLMSLPQRWRLVSANQTGESETSRGAHRMVAFATEGLDMMSQVSHVVKATLDSAERWLERAGRRGDVEYQQQQHSFVDEKALPDRQGQYP